MRILAPRLLAPLVALFSLLGLAACQPASEEKPIEYSKQPVQQVRQAYYFAVHPLHNPTKLAAAYQPLIDLLNAEIPEARFALEASRDYRAYEEKISQRTPDFLLPNPWQTLQAMDAGYRVIAMAGDARDFKGIFVVRKDSGIKVPGDLKGRSVSYPSPTALAACIMPQYFLHRSGVDVMRDIDNVYVGSQESSIMNVYLGKVAAGATWPVPWRLFQRDHPDEAAHLEAIWETEPLLNNSVMASSKVPATVIASVQRVLLSLHESTDGLTVLHGMSTARFHPADNASYALIRDFIDRFEREVRPVVQP